MALIVFERIKSLKMKTSLTELPSKRWGRHLIINTVDGEEITIAFFANEPENLIMESEQVNSTIIGGS